MTTNQQQIFHYLSTLPDEAQDELFSYLKYLSWKYKTTPTAAQHSATHNASQHIATPASPESTVGSANPTSATEAVTERTTSAEPPEKESPWDSFKTKLFK